MSYFTKLSGCSAKKRWINILGNREGNIFNKPTLRPCILVNLTLSFGNHSSSQRQTMCSWTLCILVLRCKLHLNISMFLIFLNVWNVKDNFLFSSLSESGGTWMVGLAIRATKYTIATIFKHWKSQTDCGIIDKITGMG